MVEKDGGESPNHCKLSSLCWVVASTPAKTLPTNKHCADQWQEFSQTRKRASEKSKKRKQVSGISSSTVAPLWQLWSGVHCHAGLCQPARSVDTEGQALEGAGLNAHCAGLDGVQPRPCGVCFKSCQHPGAPAKQAFSLAIEHVVGVVFIMFWRGDGGKTERRDCRRINLHSSWNNSLSFSCHNSLLD